MIRKSWYLVLIAGTLLVPAATFAASFVSGQTVAIDTAHRASGNLYAAGGSVNTSTSVNGDIYAVGGSVTVNGLVTGDVTAAGGTITLLAPVRGDVRVAGGEVTLGDAVNGDVVIFGGTVTLLPNSAVNGDVIIKGGQVSLAGRIRGNVRIHAQKSFVFDPGARIGGNLTYRAPSALALPTGVVGEVLYEPLHIGFAGMQYGLKGVFFLIFAFLAAMKMLAYLGATLLMVWIARRPLSALFQDVIGQWWPSVGRGLVRLILVPIGVGILFLTIIGILPGMLLGLIYVGLLIAAKVLAGMFFGAWLHAKIQKRPDMQITWINAVGGMVGYQLIGIVPVLGAIAQMLIFFAVFGVLATRAQKVILNK